MKKQFIAVVLSSNAFYLCITRYTKTPLYKYVACEQVAFVTISESAGLQLIEVLQLSNAIHSDDSDLIIYQSNEETNFKKIKKSNNDNATKRRYTKVG